LSPRAERRAGSRRGNVAARGDLARPGPSGTLGSVSPVSRRRKNRNKRPPARVGSALPATAPTAPEACDCPACSGADVDPQRLVAEMTAGISELLTVDDPLDAELVGTAVLAMGPSGAEGFEEALVEGLIPALERQRSAEGLALLLALGSVSADRAAEAARVAAGRLTGSGVPAPAWAAELANPVTVTGCQRISDSAGLMSVLLATFQRGGRSHAFVTTVDSLDCGAAHTILLLDPAGLPKVQGVLEDHVRQQALLQADVHDWALVTSALSPAEFRTELESALDARAVHDSAGQAPLAGAGEDDEDDGPDYATLAVLLRSHLSSLPRSPLRSASHRHQPHAFDRDVLAALAGLTAGATRSGPGVAPALPARRKRSGGPAPIYQIKVSLRGAKPPIWRRLEVPGDGTLARLHEILQAAFDWDDAHLHLFETPYGEFAPDTRAGRRSEAKVTLEQVAPNAGAAFSYLYDFGDSWHHDIKVEKLVVADPAVQYPRCTGGRRAAPPEDCGGIWSYNELVRALDGTGHPDQLELLDVLALDTAALRPERFDAEALSGALA
jgi:hypothetical protein